MSEVRCFGPVKKKMVQKVKRKGINFNFNGATNGF